MLPAILGLGGLTAKIIATAVIPRVVRAISQSFSTTRPPEPCPPSPVEGISSVPDPTPAPVLSGVSGTRIRSRKWGYAGLWHHAPSGLDLATYRLYDAANRRWISRDPLGEGVDYNLYRYCGNDPINLIDPDGLLQRDSSGRLRFTPDGSNYSGEQQLNNGTKIKIPLEGGYFRANDGRKVKAYRYTGKNKKFKSNCLGDTFGDGEFWIFPDQAGAILDGDKYTDVNTVSDSRGGDVVIYDINGAPVHSMTVLPSPPYNSGRARGRNGAGPSYNAPIDTNQITDQQRNGSENMFREPGANPRIYRP